MQKVLVLIAAFFLSAIPTLAADLEIADPYMRTSGPMAKAGAAYFEIINHGDLDDVLIGIHSDVAMKMEFHTHIDAGEGVMLMRKIEGGIPITAGGTHRLERGGDHVMIMGLTRKLTDGDLVTVTFIFEKAGEITMNIPMDQNRLPADN